ncbi:DDE-type integrase/transposase/recombinase [Streptomyces peucetius]|uniref:DDE-type integrase/transposase/recombinase n=1 Tax=Streptomyces peucetius TaxID=1950 RepID=A0ABY6HZG5_STRPE|nr:DDE-type integrase/transposase/recombinase [Streptomyces peucetius]UYQ60108.1 DDE-type integrase/transposase/recombinase [Streptomyces peucetius]
MSGQSPLAHSTVRGQQSDLRMFCSFVTGGRYGWAAACLEEFGQAPVQVCHDWNTVDHVAEYESRPSRRALTYDELQALFDAADERVEDIRRRGCKGVLSAWRDAVMLKSVYAYGTRRREAVMRIARVMRSIGLAGVRLRRRYRTTVADPAAAKAPDLIGRDFTASEPNTKYVGDITCLPLDGGKFLYLATVIDLASRRLAGWAAGRSRSTCGVTSSPTPLAAAERTRGSLAGVVMHTDHAAQYTSRAFADACRQAGVRQSMSAIGSSADNALAESFNATFKRETLQGRKHWSSEREARLDAFR